MKTLAIFVIIIIQFFHFASKQLFVNRGKNFLENPAYHNHAHISQVLYFTKISSTPMESLVYAENRWKVGERGQLY